MSTTFFILFMAVRTVLVCYLEHKKVIRLPPQSAVQDLTYLSNEFLKAFSFDSNVNLKVTFQRYNEDWGEDVDLDESDEIFDKDKLKVIVTPLLSDHVTNPTPA